MAPRLPARVRRWCAERLDDEIVHTERVPGGITDAIWRIGTAAGRSSILRYVGADHPMAPDGREWVRREGIGCRLTAGTSVPAPTLLATDRDREGTGGWANLMTFLPGEVRLDRLGPAAVDALAAVAVAVHDVRVGAAERPPDFVSWAPTHAEAPAWTTRPALWERAIALCAGPPPTTVRRLIHRDFHPGNTLWRGDRVSGLIDWAETSWGPADLDVAHACSNFAMLHSLDDAGAFRSAYERLGGRLDPDPEARRYWAALDVLGFLPDPGPVVAALIQRRPDLEPGGVRRRLEDLLERSLDAP